MAAPKSFCTGQGTVSSPLPSGVKDLRAIEWWLLFLVLGTCLSPALSLGNIRSRVSGRLPSVHFLPA